jgi:hypothetical protein
LFPKCRNSKQNVTTGVRFKDYIFPSGRSEKIQGYENIALDELINIELINENDIIVGCKNVPIIWYTTNNDVKHRHIDIMLIYLYQHKIGVLK